MTCCFFGHHDISENIKPSIEIAVRNLINIEGVTDFLVGNQGLFDSMVLSVLRKLKSEYPDISYKVVFAYFPTAKNDFVPLEPIETIYPEGLETAPKRFAISKRNDWMLRRSDIVICYVWHHFGGSSQFVTKAIKQNKRVINLYEKA